MLDHIGDLEYPLLVAKLRFIEGRIRISSGEATFDIDLLLVLSEL